MTQACGAAVTRLTIDIRHLDLAAALSLAPENRGAEQANKPEINAGKCSEARKSQPDAAHERRRRLVGLSKHLCGVATDLSLRCIKAYQGASVPGARTQASVGGVCIALCCHHLMTLRTLQTPFVKNKNDDKEWNAHPERCGRERNLKRHAR